jgi:hypothetical protein
LLLVVAIFFMGAVMKQVKRSMPGRAVQAL